MGSLTDSFGNNVYGFLATYYELYNVFKYSLSGNDIMLITGIDSKLSGIIVMSIGKGFGFVIVTTTE